MITPPTVLHVAACLVAIAILVGVGRWLARVTGQPAVIGEIAVGLLVGPVLFAALDPAAATVILPPDVRAITKVIGEVGLALLLLGVSRGLAPGTSSSIRGVTYVAVSASVPALIAGGALGAWIVREGTGEVRGDGTAAALVLFIAVATAVSAVPVLVRIIDERGLSDSVPGRHAVAAALAIDGISWVLLVVALGLDRDRPLDAVGVVARIAALVVLAVVLRRLLRRWAAVGSTVLSRPRIVGGLAGIGVVVVGLATERIGLTLILGAVVFGLALPAGTEWDRALAWPVWLGRRLVPVFFVVTGLTVLAPIAAAPPWGLVVATIALAVTAKAGGAYLGARCAGIGRPDAARVGALLNIRGLTEIVFLQAGYSAGLLTGPLFFAFVLMALVTTVLTGPVLSWIDRVERRGAGHGSGAASATAMEDEPVTGGKTP